MHFYKYHGLGNDYIVIDPNNIDIPMTKDIIQKICDRNYGVGSDGILYGPLQEGNLISVKIFNPDGSEAEKSGNGIRIFAQYLLDRHLINEDNFSISTLGGTVDITLLDKKKNLMRIYMGEVTFLAPEIPVDGDVREVVNEMIQINNSTLHVTCLSVGNPHCVIPVDLVTPKLAHELGPLIENNTLFPNRINMQLLEVIDRNTIKIEIWERGAGYTLASGSSSCAAACAAHKLNLVDELVTVKMPGGDLEIEIERNNVYMVGTVASVAEGNFTPHFIEYLTITDK